MAELFPFTLQDQIAAVKREISIRNHVYFRRVAAGQMSREKAEREIGLMEAVLETLRTVGKCGIPDG